MISTHILDTSLGKPATGVSVTLEIRNASIWKTLAEEKTNEDGRITFSIPTEVGSYRLIFKTEDYFATNRREHFFQNAEVTFKITDTKRKYHVPLLLNPYGYSTYRGT